MFRNKESSNRIELSQLVQELLNFSVFCSLCLWGVGGEWMGGGWGCPHTHAHACACMCMHVHACVVNMIISCKWLPPFGESLGIPYNMIRTCMYMHVHVCVCGGALYHHLHPHTLTPRPQGDPRNQSKFNST